MHRGCSPCSVCLPEPRSRRCTESRCAARPGFPRGGDEFWRAAPYYRRTHTYGDATTRRRGDNSMADCADVNGIRTWHDERGDGDPLVLLHGGLRDSGDFAGNLDTLPSRFRLFLPERRGHGHTPDVPGPITVDLMAQDTIAFLDQIVGGPARLAGYSAGAIVALWVAVRRPDLVDKLIL